MPKMPEVKTDVFPVFVPNDEGEVKMEVAKASLKAGTLVVEFDQNLVALAIQRALSRGVLIGLAFVMLEEKTEEDAAVEAMVTEEEPAE